jgi:GDP-L-fucose synthase
MITKSDPLYPLAGKKVWVAGHTGMVGQALCRRLATADCEVLTVDRGDIDQRRQADVEAWMAENKPDTVFMAAATVGGILANDTRSGEFTYDNLAIETNIIHAARETEVGKLMFLGAACMYPNLADQPMAEESLLTGAIEKTNEGYAIAKLAGLSLCQSYRRQYGCDFITVIPANLFGPGDNFDLEAGHVIPSLMRKADTAKRSGAESLPVWGSGKPKREFLYVDDLADALVFLIERYSNAAPINVGGGEELSIRGIAEAISKTVGFEGELSFDADKPDGAPRKLLNNTRIREMDWSPKTSLAEGLARTYEWFLENVAGRNDDAAG